MAIDRIFTTGFELNQMYYECTQYDYEVQISAVSVSATSPKTGSYCMRVYGGSGSNYHGSLRYSYPSDTSQIRGGFWFKMPTNGRRISGIPRIVTARKTDGTLLFEIECYADERWVQVKTGGVQRDTFQMVGNVWAHLSYDVKLDSSSGWCYVWLDGIEVCGYTGDTGTGTDQVNHILVGTTPKHGNYAWNTYAYYDDIFIEDSTGEGSESMPPFYQFPFRSPDGAGNYTNWTPSAGSNYQCVDEIPPNGDTDYVEATAAAVKDSYTLANYTIPGGFEVSAVIPTVAARKGSAADCDLKVGLRYSATDVVSAAQELPTTFPNQAIQGRQTTKPGGGDWDQTAVNGIEVLIESAGTFV